MNLATKQLTKKQNNTSTVWQSVLMSTRNLNVWKVVEGMWKKNKIDAVKWQKKIRQEWV